MHLLGRDMNFIEELLHDIKKQNKINKNPALFVKQNNLQQYKFSKKNIVEDDIPIQCLLGSAWLIKNCNIIEIYSWCECASLYIQINKIKPRWISKMEIVNVAKGDPENLEFLLDGCNTFYNSVDLLGDILHFIESGFMLYIKF